VELNCVFRELDFVRAASFRYFSIRLLFPEGEALQFYAGLRFFPEQVKIPL
jgi:hypothetical protein